MYQNSINGRLNDLTPTPAYSLFNVRRDLIRSENVWTEVLAMLTTGFRILLAELYRSFRTAGPMNIGPRKSVPHPPARSWDLQVVGRVISTAMGSNRSRPTVIVKGSSTDQSW